MSKEQQNAGEAGLLDDSGMASVQGFATKDGEIIPPAEKAPTKGAREAPKAEKADRVAKKPDTEAETDENEDPDAKSGESDAGDADSRHRAAQARINKAVGRQRAAERRATEATESMAAMRAEIARLSAQVSSFFGTPAGQQDTKTASPTTGMPNPAEYEHGINDIQYIRDMARAEARQELATQARQQTAAQEHEAQTRAAREFGEKRDKFLTEGLDKYDDFDEVVTSSDIPVSQTLAELFFDSDHGSDIAYALASDPKESRRVAAMSPTRQAAWFGRREAELSSGSPDADEDARAEGAVASPKVTRAPPPPATRTRGSGGQSQASAATTDFAAFERMAGGNQ